MPNGRRYEYVGVDDDLHADISTPDVLPSNGPYLFCRQFDGLGLAERRLVRVGVVGDRGAGIPGEELPSGPSGHAERGADLFPGGPRGPSRGNSISTQPLELDLAAGQLAQRVEGSGGQRMRDDQVHPTSVT